MKLFKIRSSLIIALLLCTSALAHKPLLSVDDNEDGTIYIEVGFSDGSSGSGHDIILKDKAGKVLNEVKVPAESSLDIPMPSVPYTVTFSAGPGHIVTVDGPFSEQAEDQTINEEKTTAETPAPVKAAIPEPATATQATPVAATVAPAAPVVINTPAPAVTPNGPGFEMALKMLITNSIIIAVILAFILSAFCFWVGYSIAAKSSNKK